MVSSPTYFVGRICGDEGPAANVLNQIALTAFFEYANLKRCDLRLIDLFATAKKMFLVCGDVFVHSPQ